MRAPIVTFCLLLIVMVGSWYGPALVDIIHKTPSEVEANTKQSQPAEEKSKKEFTFKPSTSYDTDIKYSEEHLKIVTDWAYKKSKKYVPIEDVREIVNEASKYKTFLLLISVMCEESKFDRYARSSKNALGLGQIMHSVWLDTLRKEGIANEKIDLFYYKTNIKAMNYILIRYYREKGSWKNALSAYVNGSKPYVLNVLSNYAELQLLLNGV